MRLLPVLAVLVALAAPQAYAEDTKKAPPEKTGPSPAETFIVDIYRAYTDTPQDAPVPAVGDEIYSKRLRALFDNDAAETPEGEVGRLDFDPFVDGQDWELGGLTVKEIYRSGGEARVRADFANFGKPRSIVFNLVREDGQWRIDDMAETLRPRWTLSKILEGALDAYPDQSDQ